MLINTKIKCFIYDSLYVLCKILLTILKAKINFICMVKFKNYQPKKTVVLDTSGTRALIATSGVKFQYIRLRYLKSG